MVEMLKLCMARGEEYFESIRKHQIHDYSVMFYSPGAIKNDDMPVANSCSTSKDSSVKRISKLLERVYKFVARSLPSKMETF